MMMCHGDMLVYKSVLKLIRRGFQTNCVGMSFPLNLGHPSQRKSSALPVVGWNWKEEFSHKRDVRYIYNIIEPTSPETTVSPGKPPNQPTPTNKNMPKRNGC